MREIKTLLAQYIKSLIFEVAISPSQAFNDQIILYVTDNEPVMKFHLINVGKVVETLRKILSPRERYFKEKLNEALNSGIVGSLKIRWNENYNGFEVKNIIAPGFGPLLYDMAMQYLTNEKNSALLPDRGSVNSSAENVWKKYFSIRPDVEKESFERSENATDDEDDVSAKPWLMTKYTNNQTDYIKIMDPDILLDAIINVTNEIGFNVDPSFLEASVDRNLDILGQRKFVSGYSY